MVVKLTLLDKQKPLSYQSIVEVYQYIDKYERIGICKISTNDQGSHYGELELDREVGLDMFFYYRGITNEDGIFEFSGLDFMQTEIKNKQTTRLREMII